MDENLTRKKVALEKEFDIIAQQKYELNERLRLIRKAIKEKEKQLEDKAKEIDNILREMENEELRIKQRKVEKAEADRKEKEKKIEDLRNVLYSKSFYSSIRNYLSKPHWKKLTKAIQSDELFTFILKHHYANRVIKAYKNELELNKNIMKAIVDKLETLIQ